MSKPLDYSGPRAERCEICTRVIPPSETPRLLGERVLCGPCYAEAKRRVREQAGAEFGDAANHLFVSLLTLGMMLGGVALCAFGAYDFWRASQLAASSASESAPLSRGMGSIAASMVEWRGISTAALGLALVGGGTILHMVSRIEARLVLLARERRD